MRIVLWNCNNGMGSTEQIDFFHSLKPDLAILPELKRPNIDQIKPNSCAWITNNFTNPRPKGLGVLGFGHVKITELPRDQDMELFLPLTIESPSFTLNLVAVWNFYSACKQGRFRGVRGDGALEWTAIRHFAPNLSAPCLFGGDWNFGPTFSQRAFFKMCGLFSDFGYQSLYHHHHGLSTDQTNHLTFKTPTGHLHHLDHLFGTADLVKRMRSYEILPVDEVVKSDHSAIILDLDIN